MSFALLKNYEIPIFNAALAIQTIVTVIEFLRNLQITLTKCSMLTFVIIKPVMKFGFCFYSVGTFTTNLTF